MNFGSGIHRSPCKFFVATCDPSIKTMGSSATAAKPLARIKEKEEIRLKKPKWEFFTRRRRFIRLFTISGMP
jgi:hypothetical protein